MLKPFSFRSQCLISESDLSIRVLPLFNPIPKINSSLPIHSLSLLPLSHRTRSSQQPVVVVCARKNNRRGLGSGSGWWSLASNRKMLQLASIIALNLKILPQPLNLLITEIARGDWNGVPSEHLNHLGRGWRRKTKRKRKKLMWFAFISLICALGLLSWRISGLDLDPDLGLFLRALFFCLLGISLIRLMWCGKKAPALAIKEWFLGFLFGIVVMSNTNRLGLGKEDVKFWVKRLRACSPVAQIVTRNNRNGKRRKGGKSL